MQRSRAGGRGFVAFDGTHRNDLWVIQERSPPSIREQDREILRVTRAHDTRSIYAKREGPSRHLLPAGSTAHARAVRRHSVMLPRCTKQWVDRGRVTPTRESRSVREGFISYDIQGFMNSSKSWNCSSILNVARRVLE